MTATARATCHPDRVVHGHGWCEPCYAHLRDTHQLVRPPKKAPWAIDANGCWVWQRSRSDQGYGTLSFQGRASYAHRVYYERYIGPLPPRGMVLDHLCSNRACVNPQHLEAVTHGENIRRGNGDVCKRGHPKTPENSYGRPGHPFARLCRECNRIRRESRKARLQAAAA